MPPKKKGKGKKGKKPKKEKEPEPEIDIFAGVSDLSLVEKELDLLNDLNDEFFGSANRIIQILMGANRTFEAIRIKKYIDIIFKLHREYAKELALNAKLQPRIVHADAKLYYALELTANTQESMEIVRMSLDEAWREADASLEREQDVQDKLQEYVLKCDISDSKEEKKQDDSAEFGHLTKYKNIILRERDRLNGEVVDLEKRLAFQRYYCESLEYVNKTQDETLVKQATRVRVLEIEKANFEVKVKNLMATVDEQKDNLGRANYKMEIVHRDLNDVHLRMQKKVIDYEHLKHMHEKVKGENSLFAKTVTKNEEEIQELRKDAKENDETIRSLRLEDKVKANTIHLLSKKFKKVMQDQASMSSKLYKANRNNGQLEADITRLKNQINAVEKDLFESNYRFEDMRHLKDKMQHDRDNLRSDITKQNNAIADLKHTIIIQGNANDSLHLDINKLNVRLDEARIQISKAEKERDEIAQEEQTLNERIELYQEQIQLKTNQVVDLTEKLNQQNFALVSVKKQLEAVHSEKMVLKRALDTCTQERDNFRVLTAKTNHQHAQFSNEISANQHKINYLNSKIEHLNGEKKELQSELKNVNNILNSIRRDLKEVKTKNESLLKTISDDEYKFMKISQELDETRKEKNLIGLQMVRRNDEIMLLKDKLVIMQTALDQGQTQYNLRLEDIRLLKIEIKNLQAERDCLTRALKSTADMRQEIIRLHRSLNQERIKVRSLTEDAKTPTGVHRWRILKGEDPNKYELLMKLQMLQRRNLRQEIEKTKLQQELAETHKVCESLKHIVENLPTTDVKQKLVATQRVNREQLRKLKALSAELAIDEIELKARECIIDEFKATLKLTKQKAWEEIQTTKNPSMSERTIGRIEVHEVYNYTTSQDDNYVDCAFTPSDITNSSNEAAIL